MLLLRLNNAGLHVPPMIAVPAMVDLARGMLDEPGLAALPRAHQG